MAVEKPPWFVAERSEALAGLLLTSRKDVRVQRENKAVCHGHTGTPRDHPRALTATNETVS